MMLLLLMCCNRRMGQVVCTCLKKKKGNLWQQTEKCLHLFPQWSRKTKNRRMAPLQPPDLWSLGGEHVTTCDMKVGGEGLKLHLSVLKVAPCVKGLTYITRMLRLLSLSAEGINPREGERHIHELVTEWHLGDWTSCPCPPHLASCRAIISLILYDPRIKQWQSWEWVHVALNCVIWKWIQMIRKWEQQHFLPLFQQQD